MPALSSHVFPLIPAFCQPHSFQLPFLKGSSPCAHKYVASTLKFPSLSNVHLRNILPALNGNVKLFDVAHCCCAPSIHGVITFVPLSFTFLFCFCEVPFAPFHSNSSQSHTEGTSKPKDSQGAARQSTQHISSFTFPQHRQIAPACFPTSQHFGFIH